MIGMHPDHSSKVESNGPDEHTYSFLNHNPSILKYLNYPYQKLIKIKETVNSNICGGNLFSVRISYDPVREGGSRRSPMAKSTATTFPVSLAAVGDRRTSRQRGNLRYYPQTTCRKKDREQGQHDRQPYKVVEITPPPTDLGVRCFPSVSPDRNDRLYP